MLLSIQPWHLAALLLCFYCGHVVRDGTPALGSTHAARVCGALLCTLGIYALRLHWQDAALYGPAVLAGFYVDLKHGDGQGADNCKSMGYLTMSGVSSVLPVMAAAALITDSWLLALIGAAILVFAAIAGGLRWLPDRVLAELLGVATIAIGVADIGGVDAALWGLVIGFAKPALWAGFWAVLRPLQNTFLSPMRQAAGVFGMLLGLLIAGVFGMPNGLLIAGVFGVLIGLLIAGLGVTEV